MYIYLLGDKNHLQSTCIGMKLLLEGYFPHLHWVAGGGENDVLARHGEKMAITCALINTPEGTPIRITKNMRVCLDCHFTTSLISKMEKRK
eukprot:c15328_g1_i1 orf=87-359(+)